MISAISDFKHEDYVSGLKLVQLVNEIFYDNKNEVLMSKMRISKQQKIGNNVLNINIILNHLKKDQNIHLDEDIKSLTAFRLIEDQQAMKKLISWLISKKIQSEMTKEVKMESPHHESPQRTQQNQFQNLYFASSIEQRITNENLDDSLQIEQKGEKVVRKGSFKVLKPKTTETKSENQFSNNEKQFCHSEKQPLKDITNQVVQQHQEEIDSRKTIPKMYQKPPLYKHNKKGKNQNQSNAKKIQQLSSLKTPLQQPKHFQTEFQNKNSNNNLRKHIQNIEKQIMLQEKSLIELNNFNIQTSNTLGDRRILSKKKEKILKQDRVQTKKSSIVESKKKQEKTIKKQQGPKHINQKNTPSNAQSNKIIKSELTSNFSSIQLPVSKQNLKGNNIINTIEQSSLKYTQLIQVKEPEDHFQTERGYKDLYLSKFKNIETPKKHQSFTNISLSKSRLKAALSSAKRTQPKPQPPSITLEMQMKVLKYLQKFETDLNIFSEDLELFKDPYRNGVLISLIVKKQYKCELPIIKKPKNISDCRQNFKKSLNQIKTNMVNFPSAYLQHIEQLIKGRQSLFYGIVWYVLSFKCQPNNSINTNLKVNEKKGFEKSADIITKKLK